MLLLEAELQKAGVKQERSSHCHGWARAEGMWDTYDPVGQSVPGQGEVSEDLEPRLPSSEISSHISNDMFICLGTWFYCAALAVHHGTAMYSRLALNSQIVLSFQVGIASLVTIVTIIAFA